MNENNASMTLKIIQILINYEILYYKNLTATILKKLQFYRISNSNFIELYIM